ncbi:MAG: D-lyxose/D-mannose family sugar isomerase [Promethearchaeota archaeon]
MKRSQINEYISKAINFFKKNNWSLPPFAFYTLEDWKKIMNDPILKEKNSEIIQKRLGWDISDFGSGDFLKTGLLLFTIRNGKIGSNRAYAEKIMIQRDEQMTPFHYHWVKCEDIINRGGGNLIVKVYNASEDDDYTPDGQWQQGIFSDSDVDLLVSGQKIRVKAGTEIKLKPGDDIVLPPRIYHAFWGEKGKGWVLVGEVSMVNDDTKDNRFYNKLPRFSDIENDEMPRWLLVNEYENALNF